MRIYFVGAQSTGKTTLARHASQQFNLPLLTETARLVLARLEKTLDDVRRDQDLLDKFQEDVLGSQLAAELRLHDFVSDRAMDFLAYAAAKTRVTAKLETAAANYVRNLALEDAYIFFVRPHREFVVPDNTRARADLEWEEVVKIDAMVEYLLESNGLRYFPVASKLLRDRIRLIDAVVEMAIKIKNTDNTKGDEK